MSSTPQSPTWSRTLAWQIRRELWEHRAIWIAPLAVAAFTVLIHFLSTLVISDAARAAALADPARARDLMTHYKAMIGVTVLSGMVVGVLYSLETLHGERRDRSILFWKSLPVSDAMTVLSKALVVAVIIPLIVLGIVIAATLVMITLQSLVWTLAGFDASALWSRIHLPFLWLSLLYGLPFMVLWNAPLFAWTLLVSAWSRRMPVLWAAAPFVAILLVEHTALHHTPAHWLIERRVAGAILQPYSVNGAGAHWAQRLADLDPVRLYTLPGLWIGIVIAAVLLLAAIRVRRSRTPN